MRFIAKYSVLILITFCLSLTSFADHYEITKSEKWEAIDSSLVLISNETNMKKRLKGIKIVRLISSIIKK